MARKFTNNQIATALRDTKGMVYLAARRLECDPKTIYNRLKRSQELRDLHEALHGETGDVAELKLYQAIQAGENWAIAFYLKTKGKNRGYVERQEVSGPNGGPVQIETYDYGIAAAELANRSGAHRLDTPDE